MWNNLAKLTLTLNQRSPSTRSFEKCLGAEVTSFCLGLQVKGREGGYDSNFRDTFESSSQPVLQCSVQAEWRQVLMLKRVLEGSSRCATLVAEWIIW